MRSHKPRTSKAGGPRYLLPGTLDEATRSRLDVTGLLRRLLADSSLPIRTFGTDGQWGEIDTPEDLTLYRDMVREGELVLEDVLP